MQAITDDNIITACIWIFDLSHLYRFCDFLHSRLIATFYMLIKLTTLLNA